MAFTRTDKRRTTRPDRTTATFACTAILVSYLPFSAVNAVLDTIGATTGRRWPYPPITTLAALTAFLILEHHATTPLPRPALFTSRGFTTSDTTGLTGFA